jgi:hypothetical protein
VIIPRLRRTNRRQRNDRETVRQISLRRGSQRVASGNRRKPLKSWEMNVDIVNTPGNEAYKLFTVRGIATVAPLQPIDFKGHTRSWLMRMIFA